MLFMDGWIRLHVNGPMGFLQKSCEMLSSKHLNVLRKVPVEEIPDGSVDLVSNNFSEVSDVQLKIVGLLEQYFNRSGLVDSSIKYTLKLNHVMIFSEIQALDNLFCLIRSMIKNILEYNSTHLDLPLSLEKLDIFAVRSFFIFLAWSLGSSADHDCRKLIASFISKSMASNEGIDLSSVFDFDVSIDSGDWISWHSLVPFVDIDSHKVSKHNDIVVPTIDTLRHEKIIYSWLKERKSLILVGPPGSGKVF